MGNSSCSSKTVRFFPPWLNLAEIVFSIFRALISAPLMRVRFRIHVFVQSVVVCNGLYQGGNMAGRLQDKVTVVTGAGNGIGRATALRFAEEGSSVIVADIQIDKADETVQIIEDNGEMPNQFLWM